MCHAWSLRTRTPVERERERVADRPRPPARHLYGRARIGQGHAGERDPAWSTINAGPTGSRPEPGLRGACTSTADDDWGEMRSPARGDRPAGSGANASFPACDAVWGRRARGFGSPHRTAAHAVRACRVVSSRPPARSSGPCMSACTVESVILLTGSTPQEYSCVWLTSLHQRARMSVTTLCQRVRSSKKKRHCDADPTATASCLVCPVVTYSDLPIMSLLICIYSLCVRTW
jgi:hypothetical protein